MRSSRATRPGGRSSTCRPSTDNCCGSRSTRIAYTDLPVAVAIDEAVDLANAYSTGDSGRYVNGVLSAVAVEVEVGRLETTGP